MNGFKHTRATFEVNKMIDYTFCKAFTIIWNLAKRLIIGYVIIMSLWALAAGICLWLGI